MKPWSEVSCNLITDLPESQGYNAMLVVVCCLIKMAHFILTTTQIDAPEVAQLFLTHVWSKHRLPDHTVSDRAAQFNIHFL